MADKRASEFGGVPGRIQPQPHDIQDSAYEQHRLIMSTDPTDATDTPEGALARERKREGR